MDESGLFYHLGPRRSYLSGNESRRDMRGTLFNKRKEHVLQGWHAMQMDRIY